MATDGLKQRLVGGVALLVIGVIAWFWLLSADSPVDPVAHATQIPAAPDLKPMAVPEPQASNEVIPAPAINGETPPAAPSANESHTATAVSPSKPVIAPTPSNTIVKSPVVATTEKKTESKIAVKAPTETFQLDQQGLPVAWVVQIGLFSTQANADRIKGALQQKGFKAYTQTVKTASGTGVKVFVGPKLSRERADAQKKAIDDAMKMNTMVVRFAPS